jgi:hypothetical protein
VPQRDAVLQARHGGQPRAFSHGWKDGCQGRLHERHHSSRLRSSLPRKVADERSQRVLFRRDLPPISPQSSRCARMSEL